jgi:hypothetical protein
MHKGRLVDWEEELHPPVPRKAARSTRRAVVQAGPGHRRRPRDRRAASWVRIAALRRGSEVLSGLERWGSLNACKGFGMASTGEF